MAYVYLYGGAIGDALFGVHLGRALSETVPGSTLTLISTRPNAFVRELVGGLPFISYHEVVRSNPLTWVPLWRLACGKNNIAVLEPSDIPVSFWWRTILRVSQLVPGGSEVHGYIAEHERAVRRSVHQITITPEDNLFMTIVPRVLSSWGLSPVSVQPHLPRASCATVGKPYILFHFFAGSYRRSMPPEKVRPLLERAREVFPTYEFVLSAAPAERSRAMSMIAGMANARIESELSAQALLCLLQGATLVVAVASGIAHLAAHLDAPLIALSNLSDPYWLPTYNSRVVILADREHCRCRGNKSGDCSQTTADGEVFRCLYYIPTDRIVDSMQSLLAR